MRTRSALVCAYDDNSGRLLYRAFGSALRLSAPHREIHEFMRRRFYVWRADPGDARRRRRIAVKILRRP